ncbi:MAG: hypothetical protein HQL32_18225, partial [Planctomycetes bacterium]|nr:hypothetical protein [Planctomycetota bacterium]
MKNRFVLYTFLVILSSSPLFAAKAHINVRLASFEKAVKFSENIANAIMPQMGPAIVQGSLSQALGTTPGNLDIKGLLKDKAIYLRSNLPLIPGLKPAWALYIPVSDFDQFVSTLPATSPLKAPHLKMVKFKELALVYMKGNGDEGVFKSWAKDTTDRDGVLNIQIDGQFLSQAIDAYTPMLQMMAGMMNQGQGMNPMHAYLSMLQSIKGQLDDIQIFLDSSNNAISLNKKVSPTAGTTWAKVLEGKKEKISHVKGLKTGNEFCEM